MPVIAGSCVPDVTNHTTEKSHLEREIGLGKPDSNPDEVPLSMPSMMDEPLSERDPSVHIERMAFPTLFPHGSASFNNPRIRTVSTLEYHKHLMFYKDQRFARHPTFRYWALNTQMRHQADGYAKWFTRLTPDKMATIEELRALVNNPDSHLEDMITRKTANLRGTRPYWGAASSELEAMVKDLNGQNHIYTGASMEDEMNEEDRMNMKWEDMDADADRGRG